MTVLNRDAFISDRARQTHVERVPTPEFGDGSVALIKGMNGSDRDSYEAGLIIQRGRKSTVDILDMRAKLVVRCLVDEQGARLFKDDEYAQIGQMRADVLDRLYRVAQKLSGLSDEDMDELGKSSTAPNGTSSSSSSPGN